MSESKSSCAKATDGKPGRATRPRLWLQIYIGPTGFNWMEARLLDKKPESQYAVGKGEGQAMLFELVDGDYSTEFYKALCSGEVFKDVGGRRFDFDLHKVLREARHAKR